MSSALALVLGKKNLKKVLQINNLALTDKSMAEKIIEMPLLYKIRKYKLSIWIKIMYIEQFFRNASDHSSSFGL